MPEIKNRIATVTFACIVAGCGAQRENAPALPSDYGPLKNERETLKREASRLQSDLEKSKGLARELQVSAAQYFGGLALVDESLAEFNKQVEKTRTAREGMDDEKIKSAVADLKTKGEATLNLIIALEEAHLKVVADLDRTEGQFSPAEARRKTAFAIFRTELAAAGNRLKGLRESVRLLSK